MAVSYKDASWETSCEIWSHTCGWDGASLLSSADMLNMAIEIVDFHGFSHEKWWFSIVFCMFTRGYIPKSTVPKSGPGLNLNATDDNGPRNVSALARLEAENFSCTRPPTSTSSCFPYPTHLYPSHIDAYRTESIGGFLGRRSGSEAPQIPGFQDSKGWCRWEI